MTRQFKNVLVASAAFASLLGISSPTFAVTMKAVYQGTVSNSDDQFNLFEQGGGGSLNGLSYMLTFIYDAATPGAVRDTTGIYDSTIGGTYADPDTVNPVQSATLAIGGHSEVISTDNFGQAVNYNDGFSTAYGVRQMQDYFSNDVTLRNDFVYAYAYDGSLLMPIDLDTPFEIAVAALPSHGYFQFYHYDYVTSQDTAYTYGFLTASSLTVTRVGEVPLPAALPLFAAGLSAMGFMGWRRRKAAVAG